MAKRKETILDLVIIDSVKVLKQQTKHGIKLVFVPPTGMNGRDFDRWKIHHSQILDDFMAGKVIDITTKDPEMDQDLQEGIQIILEALEISRRDFNKLTSDQLIVKLLSVGLLSDEITTYKVVMSEHIKNMNHENEY